MATKQIKVDDKGSIAPKISQMDFFEMQCNEEINLYFLSRDVSLLDFYYKKYPSVRFSTCLKIYAARQ